ncbi:hypothetical protein VTK56DRAFT_5466 [Thermocarpiscus australiensis]
MCIDSPRSVGESAARRDPDALPISPIVRNWPGLDLPTMHFGAWYPESWRGDDDTRGQRVLDWLVSRWKGCPNYQPLPDDFLNNPNEELEGELAERARHHLAELKSESIAAKHGRYGGRQEVSDSRIWTRSRRDWELHTLVMVQRAGKNASMQRTRAIMGNPGEGVEGRPAGTVDILEYPRRTALGQP